MNSTSDKLLQEYNNIAKAKAKATPTHNFCWVVKDYVSAKEASRHNLEVIWVSKENLRHLEGLGVPIRIPYYILKHIKGTEREEMKKRLLEENPVAESFEQILQDDRNSNKYDGSLKELAEITRQFIEAVENSGATYGNKICSIVDVMKFYMAAREEEVAIDYNVTIKNKEKYLQILQQRKFCFSCVSNTYVPYFENKLVFLGAKRKKAINFIKDIILSLDPSLIMKEYINFKEKLMLAQWENDQKLAEESKVNMNRALDRIKERQNNGTYFASDCFNTKSLDRNFVYDPFNQLLKDGDYYVITLNIEDEIINAPEGTKSYYKGPLVERNRGVERF